MVAHFGKGTRQGSRDGSERVTLRDLLADGLAYGVHARLGRIVRKLPAEPRKMPMTPIPRRPLSSLLRLHAAVLLAAVLMIPGAQAHEPAHAGHALGTVHFPVSCSAPAQ